MKLDNGLTVTPITMPYSKLQNMLGINMWSFLVQPPAPDTSFYAKAELRTPGKNAQNIALENIGHISHDVELTLGLMPIDGTSFVSATKWKSTLHMSEFLGEGIFNDGTSFSEPDNPVKSFQDVSLSTYGASSHLTPVTVRPEGEVVLMTCESGPTEKRVVSELVLIFQAESNKAKK